MAHLVPTVLANPVTQLFGLPGQGKTTLVGALWEEPAVRSRFPDGVLWATAGQHADLIRIQREWIHQLNGNLNERLLPKAIHIELGPMHPAESRELVRRASRNQVTDPHTLDEVAKRVGHLALALKVVGVLLASAPWTEIQHRLDEGHLSRLLAGQRSVFASLLASMELLPANQQQQYKELVIFPPDDPLEEAVVVRLWKATGSLSSEATHYLLDFFQSRALIQSNGALHDLQVAFLQAEEITNIEQRRAWQNILIASYGTADQWGNLPNDDGQYGWLGIWPKQGVWESYNIYY